MSLAPAFDSELEFGDDIHVVDFISDIHLSETMPATAAAWERYMAGTQADAVFLLGDVFEVWVGDDARTRPFEARCTAAIAATAARVPVWIQHGNRDFLIGSRRSTYFTFQAFLEVAAVEQAGQRIPGRLLPKLLPQFQV